MRVRVRGISGPTLEIMLVAQRVRRVGRQTQNSFPAKREPVCWPNLQEVVRICHQRRAPRIVLIETSTSAYLLTPPYGPRLP